MIAVHTNPATELDDYLDLDGQDPTMSADSSGHTEFQIESDEQAAWAARKLATAQAAINEREEYAARQVDRIAAWVADATKQDQRRVEYFTNLLTYWHTVELQRDEKRKTIKLPDATLTARAGQPKFEFDDEVFKAWAADNLTAALRAKIEVDRVACKQLLTAAPNGREAYSATTGEQVPGVTVIPSGTSFSVKIVDGAV